MAIFQYLKNKADKTALRLDMQMFVSMITDPWIDEYVSLARINHNDKEAYAKCKGKLPAVQWVGYDANPKPVTDEAGAGLVCQRAAQYLTPTQYYMVDIDHMHEDPCECWAKISELIQQKNYNYKIAVVHVTPSGCGLRIVARATQNFPTVKEHMDWLVSELHLDAYGDYDAQCKDLSRLSFIVSKEDFLELNLNIFDENDTFKPIQAAYRDNEQKTENIAEEGSQNSASELSTEEDEYRKAEYRGHLYTEIADAYVKHFGAPDEGEKHNYYNEMVKYFRCICNNNARLVHAILPRFGHSAEETWSQCKGICKQNQLSRIPKPFFMFLLDKGFYPKRAEEGDVEKMLDAEVKEEKINVPTLPPVFRELCRVCPEDFILPTINATMPILGTLTSYLRAEYWDGKEQSTTFFNVVYAPPGSGKSFCERIKDTLFPYLIARDDIASLRDELYNEQDRRAADGKSPDNPHVSVRIAPAIISQPELLTKMRDNKGFHMFTFAEEIDTFNKGTKAGGADKSDMFRIAWDNGKYGQAFKSNNTFKGMVNLYYNILLTGTMAQLRNYYKNVENGMVTRVSFCEIKNQAFAKAQMWKKLSAKERATIDKILKRCDDMTYETPLEYDLEDAYQISGEDFDKEVPWKYQFRPFTHVQMDWMFKPLLGWLENQRVSAAQNLNYAQDTFRRRTAVKGFRLALMCTALYTNIGKREQEIIKNFVLWWMDTDLKSSLELFEEKYNDTVNDAAVSTKRWGGMFEALPDNFEKSDIIALSLQRGYKTPWRKVSSLWMSEGLIVRDEGKNKFRKVYPKAKKKG